MEWISAKIRSPEKSCGCLCHVIVPYCGKPLADIKILWYNSCDKRWECKDSDGIITHWMPLPEFPKEIII